MIIQYKLVAICLYFSFAQLNLLMEDFNSLGFGSQGWKCKPSDSESLIYHCPNGMDLVQLSQECNKIEKTILNIPPHYSVQLYVDFVAFMTIDGGEVADISADNTNIYSYFKEQAGFLPFSNQCDPNIDRYDMITSIVEFVHSSSQLTISFFTNINEPFPNEGYPFRNLQIYYKQCHYTCKTCSNEAYNQCLSCFTINPTPTLQQCKTCEDQQNLRFLLQTQGCLMECPEGYSYDKQLVCQRNLMLKNLLNLNTLLPMTSQQLLLTSNLNPAIRSPISCNPVESYLPYYQDEVLYTILNLDPSAIGIRLKATINIFGSWTPDKYFQIKVNGQIIDSINFNNLIVTTQNSIILYSDVTNQICSSKNKFTVRIELNQIITGQVVNLSFNAYNLVDQTLSWSVSNINLEQEVCSLMCGSCADNYNCDACLLSYFLYKGQCILDCPPYSKMVGTQCIDLDEEVIDKEKSKIKYLVKEFYDISTTKERVNELFQLVSQGSNNFAKGSDIYFSYVPGKKVFGGALVWVNAVFKLQLEMPKYYYQVRVNFQVILGDDFDPGDFQYQINYQNNVILTKQTSNPIQNTQIWGDIKPDYVFQVDQIVNKDDIQNRYLIIQFNCNNQIKQVQQAFCAIQNLFITAEFYCTKEYRFDIFNYEKGLNPCIPICGDGFVVDEEQCDDGNMDPFDGCFSCQYQCQEHCQNCVYGICLFNQEGEDENQKFFENEEDIQEKIYHYDNQSSNYYGECQVECQICKEGNCYLCMEGYYIEQITQICYLQIIGCSDDQQCSTDIQNNAQMSSIDYRECQIECLSCKFGLCYECLQGYYLDLITLNCYLLIIGCNNVQSYSKEVQKHSKMSVCEIDISYSTLDSIYQDPDYVCINCLTFAYQSCNNKCSFCYQGQCLQCQSGYTLYENQDCLSICGDGLLNKDQTNQEFFEQCDNPLNEGCQNCVILPGYKCIQEDSSLCWTCDSNCLKCIVDEDNQLVCQQCIDGYYAVSSFCLICDDNCITCKDDSALCTSCYRDDCQKCEAIPGLYTDYEIKKCIPQCGDGIKIQYYEQCDDGNIIDGDGCDSECNSELPQEQYSIGVKRLNGLSSNDLSIIQDSYIQLNCLKTTVSIDGFDKEQFIYNSTSSDTGCKIQFQFFKSIYKTNLIHIYIQFQEIYTRILEEQNQQYKEIQVDPIEQIILDDSQQAQADAISSAQSSLSLLIWILAPLSILFGLFDYLWAVLEILSWINNFYFFNVNFPFNVQILFLNSDWSSIVNFPTYQNLNQPGCDYYFESPPRFSEKGVDPLFINNAQVPAFFIFTSIILYFVSLIIEFFFKVIDKLFEKKVPLHNHTTFSIQKQQDVQLHYQKQSQYLTKSNKYTQYLVQKLKMVSNSFQSRIKQTITLCLLDLTMAITLQLIFGKQFYHKMILINTILALSFCVLIIYQLRQSYYVIGIHKSLAEFPLFQQKYGCYFENINIENTFGLKFNFFGLIRKITYIFCLVYFYYTPLLQTTLCFISCSSGVLLLLYSNPFESKGQLYKQLISESGLSLIIFITILLSIDDLLNKMEEQTKINMGWVIISLVLICVFCEIITLIFEICRLLYEITVQTFKFLIKKHQATEQIETNNETQQPNVPETIILNRLSFKHHHQLHQYYQ
ncbi:unnamed protein product [Paramecium octaurelia]|uniref:Insulin-like growth factor binding protein, N-terminal n=1 Tax=Paramecium octaurelia TaxID=43137 RepID=A0A8S1WV02_PAROT|nr:unnamed protein product [Paramecium octaurelia]